MKYIPLFILIQLVSLVLSIIGVPVCAVLAFTKYYKQAADGKYHFPSWAWIWDNREDGVCAQWYATAHVDRSFSTNVFIWSALRNSSNNLRYVPGVSKIGRPLWRKTWGAKPGGFYFQAGWNPSGFPVISGGRNSHVY